MFCYQCENYKEVWCTLHKKGVSPFETACGEGKECEKDILCFTASEEKAEKSACLYLFDEDGVNTHSILKAIASSIGKNVVYYQVEDYVKDLIGAICQKQTKEFRFRLEEADVLVIEGVDFLDFRESTLEELALIVSRLLAANKLVLLSGSKPLRKIEGIAQSLVSNTIELAIKNPPRG